MGLVLAVSSRWSLGGSVDEKNPASPHGGEWGAATGEALRAAGGPDKTGNAAHAETFVCYASPRRGCGYPDSAGVVGAQ